MDLVTKKPSEKSPRPDREKSARSGHDLCRHALMSLPLLAVVGSLFACSAPDQVEWVRHLEWSPQVHYSQWPDVTHRGLLVGFVRSEDRGIHPYQRPPNDKFAVKAGERLSILLIFATGRSQAYPVMVSAFLDYEQVSFTLDGRQGLLHYLEVRPGVDTEIPLEVPVNASGWHDFFVVAFPQPDYHPRDPQERLPPALAISGRRAVICAGNCEKPDRETSKALIGQGTAVRDLNAYAFPLLLDDGRPAKQRLLLSAVAESQDYALQLLARNPTDRHRDYLVLPLVDFRQTPYAGSRMLHLQMPPGSELIIPGQIRLPKAEGVHELQFVCIFDPFRDLAEVSDPFVQSVMRSAIAVESNRKTEHPK